MCVRITKNDTEIKYNSKISLEKQLVDATLVSINCKKNADKDLDSFISEMSKLCQNGIHTNVEVKVTHADTIRGMKAKNQIKKLAKSLVLNDAIKLLVTTQRTMENSLEEMANICLRKNVE
jgi:rRNA processing protein Krr1/Pno1